MDARRSSLAAVCATLLCTTLACTSLEITHAPPKVYGEDAALRFLSDHFRAVDAFAASLQEAAAQETLGVREGRRLDATVTLTPAVPGQAPAVPAVPGEPLVLGTLPGSDGLGLRYSELLQRAAHANDERLVRQLQYAGDEDFLDANKQISLVRFEASIPRAIRLNRFWKNSRPEYARIDYSYCSPSGRTRAFLLGPELDTVVSKEQLVTSLLEDLSLAGGGPVDGVQVSGAGRMQHALEEALASITATPVEFTIPVDADPEKPNCAEFAFVIGPRRILTKRSVVNPLRYLSTTYRIDYEISPGPRDTYALFVEDRARESSLDVRPAARLTRDPRQVPAQAAPRLLSISHATEATAPSTDELRLLTPSLFTKAPNDLLVETKAPLTANTEAVVGSVSVPARNVRLLGRHLLLVRVEPSQVLEAARVAQQGTVAVQVLVPGAARAEVRATLLDGGPPAAPFTLSPSLGKAYQQVTLTRAPGGTVDLRRVASLLLSTGAAVTQILEQKEEKMVFVMPEPPRDGKRDRTPAVALILVLNDAARTKIVVPNAFTYQ